MSANLALPVLPAAAAPGVGPGTPHGVVPAATEQVAQPFDLALFQAAQGLAGAEAAAAAPLIDPSASAALVAELLGQRDAAQRLLAALPDEAVASPASAPVAAQASAGLDPLQELLAQAIRSPSGRAPLPTPAADTAEPRGPRADAQLPTEVTRGQAEASAPRLPLPELAATLRPTPGAADTATARGDTGAGQPAPGAFGLEARDGELQRDFSQSRDERTQAEARALFEAARAAAEASAAAQPASAAAAAGAGEIAAAGDVAARSLELAGGTRLIPELPQATGARIVQDVRLLAERGGGQIEIRLDPPELGRLELRVRMHQDRVVVSLVAEHGAAADLLGRSAGELRQALEAQGLRVDRVEIETHEDAASGQAFGDADARAQERSEHGADRNGGGASNSTGSGGGPAPRRLELDTLGAVDVRV